MELTWPYGQSGIMTGVCNVGFCPVGSTGGGALAHVLVPCSNQVHALSFI